MRLSLTRNELVVLSSAVGSVIKAGQAKEKDMKPNSTEAKVLEVNKKLGEKLTYASDIIEKEKRIVQDVDLNRSEAKVLIATLLLVKGMQVKSLEEYEKRPDSHESFKNEDGRRRVDYISRLKQRMEDVDSIMNKVRKAL